MFSRVNLYLVLFLLLPGCNSLLRVENRLKNANNLVKNSNFVQKNIQTDDFLLFSFQKITNKSDKTLNIYIEGDGLAWIDEYHLSRNPTPTDPMALKMALEDNSENVVYIARPCQFVDFKQSQKCQNNEYWSRARFAPEIVNSVNQAIDSIKKQYQFNSVNLYGFSGGGAIAVLVAAKRNAKERDVKFIGTIAANLDHEMFSKIHGSTPLDQSLNPINFALEVSKIEQIHLIGMQDQTVPYRVVESFNSKVNKVSSLKPKSCIQTFKNFDHEYYKWPEIWSKIVKDKNHKCN